MSTVTDQPIPAGNPNAIDRCPNCGAGPDREDCPVCAEYGPHEAPCYHDRPPQLARETYERVESQPIRRRQLTTVGDIQAELERRARLYRSTSAPDHRARAEALEAVISWLEEPIR